MDISEPAEELQPDATDLVFKTPMHVNHSKHFSAPMSEDSGNSSAFSPELLNSTSGSLYLGIQKTTRKLKRESLFLTPDSRSSDSQLSIGSECSSVNGNLLGVIEGSPDSGLDCESFCSSVRDFVVHDPDEDSIISHHIPCISDCDTKQHLAAPANFVSPKKVGRIPTGSVTFESVRKVWQSTPANADIKITRPTFGTPLECPDLKQSPTKRRRVSSRKASRDLFQSRRKVPTAFQRPFLGDYPTIQSLMQTSFVGRETVDFLSYLGKHSVLQPAMDIILGSLEPADLCRACLVSRSWKNVIENDPTALQRKRDYVDLRNQIKENLHLVCITFMENPYQNKCLYGKFCIFFLQIYSFPRNQSLGMCFQSVEHSWQFRT